MRKVILAVAGLVTLSVTSFAQSSPGDSQTLQALLKEVQGLREDMRSTTIAAQRSQILLYRLQDEEAAVARASQRVDFTRAALYKIQTERKIVEMNIKQDEESQNSEENPAQRDVMESTVRTFKTQLESLQNEEQSAQSREMDAEQKLQAEEMRLAELRSELEGLDKSLENTARRPARTAQ
jgi:chromosome segregation ATPase